MNILNIKSRQANFEGAHTQTPVRQLNVECGNPTSCILRNFPEQIFVLPCSNSDPTMNHTSHKFIQTIINFKISRQRTEFELFHFSRGFIPCHGSLFLTFYSIEYQLNYQACLTCLYKVRIFPLTGIICLGQEIKQLVKKFGEDDY